MAENENTNVPASEVVVDHAKSSWSDLWKKEDYLTIWLGFIVLIVGFFIYFNNKPADMQEVYAKSNAILKAEAARAPFKTMAWYEAELAKEKVRARNAPIGKAIAKFTHKPNGWKTNPLDAFIMSKEQADALNVKNMPKYEKAKALETKAKSEAMEAEKAAEAAKFEDKSLNAAASDKIDAWLKAKSKASSAKKKTQNKPYNLFPSLIGLMIVIAIFFRPAFILWARASPDFLKDSALCISSASSRTCSPARRP